MPKITNKPARGAQSTQPEAKPKTTEATRSGKKTNDQKVSNFTPGVVPTRPAEQLNPAPGTATASRIADIYAKNAPSPLSYLDAQGGFLPARMPTQAELAGASKITFGRHGAPEVQDIKAGGKLVIEYDADRSPIQDNLGSTPAWGVTAYIEFQPGGQRIEAPAVGFKSQTGGRVSPQPFTVPIAIDVPKGTTGVAMWFRQFQGADQPTEAWDSNFGRNYNLPVKS